MNRTMRCAVALAAMLSATGGNEASAQRYVAECRSAYSGGVFRTVCSGGPDARTARREDVPYRVKRAIPVAPPEHQLPDPNFCGPGFRFTADGCKPALR